MDNETLILFKKLIFGNGKEVGIWISDETFLFDELTATNLTKFLVAICENPSKQISHYTDLQIAKGINFILKHPTVHLANCEEEDRIDDRLKAPCVSNVVHSKQF